MELDIEQLKRRFTKVRVALMNSDMFAEMGPVMMLGKRQIVDFLPTACTDGLNELYGAHFCNELSNEELGFVIIHENYHKMCRHTVLYRKLWERDKSKANRACDYWINNKLDHLDPHGKLIAMPCDKETGTRIGLIDHKYDGLSVPEIFKLLPDDPGGGGGGGEGGGGFDEHDWDGLKDLTPDQIKEMQQSIDDAIRQGVYAARKAGVGKGNQALGLQDLLESKVDYREQLREFVRATCRKLEMSTWRRPNRRFMSMDIVMPTLYGQSIKELVLAVDASGSMMGKPLQVVMSEVEGVAQQLSIERIHLIYWDGDVERHEQYTAATFPQWRTTTTPMGGGGTTPVCVPRFLKEHKIKPDAVIVFTDGEVCGWGESEWDWPVLWGIYNPHNKITAPIGKTIHIEDDWS
jgi:predicted metal-dependent peptidase